MFFDWKRLFDLDAPPGPLLCVNFEWPMSPKAARPFFFIRMLLRKKRKKNGIILSNNKFKVYSILYHRVSFRLVKKGLDHIHSLEYGLDIRKLAIRCLHFLTNQNINDLIKINFSILKTPTVVSHHDVQCICYVDMLEHSKYRRTIRIFPHCQSVCSHHLTPSLYSLLSCPMSLAKLFRIYLNSYVTLSPSSDNTKIVQRF